MEHDDSLYAALAVFVRYGFRKTSMADLAREIGVSRQALYKKYGSKTEVFDAVSRHFVDVADAQTQQILADDSLALTDKIVRSLDCWAGHYIDELRASPHSYEVIAMAENSPIGEERWESFMKILKKLITKHRSDLSKAYIDDISITLSHLTTGLVHKAKDRQDFLTGVEAALRVLIPTSNKITKA